MKYSTVCIGVDAHKETFSLCCYTNEKRRLMAFTAKSSTTSRQCVSTMETMLYSYAIMRLAASGSRYITS